MQPKLKNKNNKIKIVEKKKHPKLTPQNYIFFLISLFPSWFHFHVFFHGIELYTHWICFSLLLQDNNKLKLVFSISFFSKPLIPNFPSYLSLPSTDCGIAHEQSNGAFSNGWLSSHPIQLCLNKTNIFFPKPLPFL